MSAKHEHISLSAEQLHDIVGSFFFVGKNASLELATSTMHHAAEELRLVSAAARTGADNAIDVSNVLHALSERLGAIANLCDELGRKDGAS